MNDVTVENNVPVDWVKQGGEDAFSYWESGPSVFVAEMEKLRTLDRPLTSWEQGFLAEGKELEEK